MAASLRGHKHRKLNEHAYSFFLCHLGLTIKLNFDISKVVYCTIVITLQLTVKFYFKCLTPRSTSIPNGSWLLKSVVRLKFSLATLQSNVGWRNSSHSEDSQTPRSPLPELSLPRPISRLNPGRKREFQITCLRMLRCPQALPPPPPNPIPKVAFPAWVSQSPCNKDKGKFNKMIG